MINATSPERQRIVEIGPIFHEVTYAEQIARGLRTAILEQAAVTQGRLVIVMEGLLTPSYFTDNVMELQLEAGFSPSQAYYLAHAIGANVVPLSNFHPGGENEKRHIALERANRTDDDTRLVDAVFSTLDALQSDPIVGGRIVATLEKTEDNDILAQKQEIALIEEMKSTAIESLLTRHEDPEIGRRIYLNATRHSGVFRRNHDRQLGTSTLNAMDRVDATHAIILAGANHEQGVGEQLQIVTVERQQERREHPYPSVTSRAIDVFGAELKASYSFRLENQQMQGEPLSRELLSRAFIENILLDFCGKHLLIGKEYDYNAMSNAITDLVGTIPNPDSFLESLKTSPLYEVCARAFSTKRNIFQVDRFVIMSFSDRFIRA